jgi:hypothetical protein
MSNILVSQNKRSNESKSSCENETRTRTESVEKGQKNEVKK